MTWLLLDVPRPNLGRVARAVIVRSIDVIESLVYPTALSGSVATAVMAYSPAVTVGSKRSAVAEPGCDHCALRMNAVVHECRKFGPWTAEITVYSSGLAIARVGAFAYFNSPNMGAWIGRI